MKIWRYPLHGSLTMRNLRALRRTTRRLQRLLLTVAVIVGAGLMLVYGRVLYLTCSTEKATEFIQDLCATYDRGEVAGNLCHPLCHEDQFSFRRCGNNKIGKQVVMMTCRNCGRHGRPADVVLKSKLDMNTWQRDNVVFFRHDETITSMLERTNVVVNKFFQAKFKTDLSKRNDSLSYIWGQSFWDYVDGANATIDGRRRHAQAALQSILALAKQEEYGSMVLVKDLLAPYVPLLYGTCGPAYVVEFTPSFPSLDYNLYQGKVPDFNLVPKSVPWPKRAKAALDILKILGRLEKLDPPVFLCDIRPHNLGLNSRGDVAVLDVDSFEYDELCTAGKTCSTDKDCNFINCRGKCNLTTHTCSDRPVSSHLQTACKYVFSSTAPRFKEQFGLLRGPPSPIATQVTELVRRCASDVTSGPLSWRSDEDMWKNLTTLLVYL